jgi:hypothetical protein
LCNLSNKGEFKGTSEIKEEAIDKNITYMQKHSNADKIMNFLIVSNMWNRNKTDK